MLKFAQTDIDPKMTISERCDLALMPNRELFHTPLAVHVSDYAMPENAIDAAELKMVLP